MGTETLKKVTFGKNIKIIERNAFEQTGIEVVVLPDSLEKIKDNAFSNCPELTDITFGKNILQIDKRIVSSCNKLQNIYVSEENTAYSSVGGLLCSKDGMTLEFYPTGREEILVPEKVTVLGKSAFQGLLGTEITVPDGIQAIDASAFSGCENLEKITICKSVTNIDPTAFYGCNKLAEIAVHEENTVYSSIDGILCSKDEATLVAFPGGKSEVVIPESIKVIGKCSFYELGITEIVIPSTVERIEPGAFEFCSRLSSVTIESGVKYIEESAFIFCFALQSIYIPASVVEIGEGAFTYNAYGMIIYCEAEEAPEGYQEGWNGDGQEIVWGHIPEE